MTTGGDEGPDPSTGPRPRRRADATVRFLWLAAVAVVALLSSAYALGHSMAPERARQATGHVTRPDDTRHAQQPPQADARPHATPTPHGDGTPGNGQDGTAVPPSGDGLFGAHVTTDSPAVALTFDDGPDPRYTPQILAALRYYDVRATFCVVGENARAYPELIRAIVADGHTLCNHSWDHDELLGRRPADVIRADLLRTNAAIRDAVPDARIAYFRQPGGAWTYPVVAVADELGLIPVHWTVDPSDWRAPGAAQIAWFVSTRVRTGSIVLLHDAGGNRQGTVDALYSLLPDLAGRFPLAALPVGTP
jgi:peptidoglycan/xylan/chitin deacetylase (PgdA/CDA1 family)